MTPDERKAKLIALIDQAAAEGWTTLDLTGYGLSELPPEIGKLTNLRSLDLDSTQPKELPEYIGQLANL